MSPPYPIAHETTLQPKSSKFIQLLCSLVPCYELIRIKASFQKPISASNSVITRGNQLDRGL